MGRVARTGGQRWIAAGKLKPIEPKFLFYMIWATTQQYANAAHEMATLNGGRPLDDKAFERAKSEVIEIILRGVAAGRGASRVTRAKALPPRAGVQLCL